MEYKQEFYEKKDPVPNRTGIPNEMKQRFENKSGLSFDDVRVHYNSGRPVQLRALAYTQGSHVYIAPGQEKHLPHELGHVVQQKQGRVHADSFVGKNALNTDPVLEAEADVIGQTVGRERFPEKEKKDESRLVIQRFNADGTLEKSDGRQEDVVEKVDGYTLHHIVPVNVLNGMWNKWIRENTWEENMEKICDYFEGMVNRDPNGKLKNTMAMVKKTRRLMLQVAVNKLRERTAFEDIQKELFPEALGLMQWMPRNFVVGPMVKKGEGNRNPDYDPKDKFDIAGAAVAAAEGSEAFSDYKVISPSTEVPDVSKQYTLYGNALDEGYQSLTDKDKREIYIGKLQAVTGYVIEFGSELTENMGQYEDRNKAYEAAVPQLEKALKTISEEKLKSENIKEYSNFQEKQSELGKIANDMKEAIDRGNYVKELTDLMKKTVANWKKAKYVIKAAVESVEKSKEAIGEDPIPNLTEELKGCLDQSLQSIEGINEINLNEWYGSRLEGLSERAQGFISAMEGYLKGDSNKETADTETADTETADTETTDTGTADTENQKAKMTVGGFFDEIEEEDKAENAKERKDVREMIDIFGRVRNLDLFSERTSIFDKSALDKVKAGAKVIGDMVVTCSRLQEALKKALEDEKNAPKDAKEAIPSSTFKYFGEDNKTLLLEKDGSLHSDQAGNPQMV